jgi:hypothetical protein
MFDHRPISAMLLLTLLIAGAGCIGPNTPKSLEGKMAIVDSTGQNLPIPPAAAHYVTGLILLPLSKPEGNDYPGPQDRVVASIQLHQGNAEAFTQETPQAYLLPALHPQLAEAMQLLRPGQRARAWVQGDQAGASSPIARVQVYDLEFISFERLAPKPVVPLEMTSPSKD